MANGLVGSLSVNYDPLLVDLNPDEFHGKVLAGDLMALHSALNDRSVLGHFMQQASTDTAAALTVIDLTANGVVFPAATYRWLMADVFTRNSGNTELAWKRFGCIVLGGTTPVIPAGIQNGFNFGSAALDTELVPAFNVQTNNVCLQLVTVPAAEFRHRCQVFVGPLVSINDTNL